MEDIRTCDILEMSLGKVRSMAKEHSVPLGKCQSLDDFRERLMLHKNKMMERNFDIQHEFSALKRRESSRCMTVSMQQQLSAAQEALRGLQSEVMESLEQVLQSPVRNHGNRTPLPVLSEIEARISKLTESECSVVVAGETNAGKSTLLNLLLGMEVLPTSILSCTAVVCTLRYASDYSADVFYADGHVEHLNFTDLDDARRGLEDIAAETDHTKREQKPKLSKLDVYMPAAILQSGVTLVDTPGHR
ncbi:hypothetical protein C0Q70_15456 [Pomacea canaliculata]|uniref:Dynamin N-terminal domain-containing protein n=1 Tax=Pomacea canaliculata TaxID=400727 RepID=A0A2T7NUV5_POMCA|nr:hypothetical protein C0Q70_15456 [Pomacea canaliculata]